MSARARTTSWIPTFKQHQAIATDTLLTHSQHIFHASMSRNYVPSNNTCRMSGQCCRHTPHPCVTHTYLEATLAPCLTTATGAVLIHTQHVLDVRVRQDCLVHAHLQGGQSAKHHPISCSRKQTSKIFYSLLKAHAPYMFQEVWGKTWSWKNTKVIGGRIPSSRQNHILTKSTLKRENHRYLWVLSWGDLNFCLQESTKLKEREKVTAKTQIQTHNCK